MFSLMNPKYQYHTKKVVNSHLLIKWSKNDDFGPEVLRVSLAFLKASLTFRKVRQALIGASLTFLRVSLTFLRVSLTLIRASIFKIKR